MSDAWTTALELDEFACLCCPDPHIALQTDPDSLSLTHRTAEMGPMSIGQLIVGSDVALDCGDSCSAYRVNVLLSGGVDSVYRDASLHVRGGSVLVYPPEGHAAARWRQGSRMVAVKIDRTYVDDALSDALGRALPSQIDFRTAVAVDTAPAISWLAMLRTFSEHMFGPAGMLRRPLVGLPYVESLVRGLLLVADHPHRDAVAQDPRRVSSRVVRAAIDIIEAEAHLPITVTALATRTHVSVRGLQQGFRRELGVSPMGYLREVRLRRAHDALLQADPATASVTSISYQWGFTNHGRFAAAYAARYGESPAVTLKGRSSER